MDNNLNQFILQEIESSIATKQKLLSDKKVTDSIQEVANICLKVLQQGGKVILAGNGGSAADAQHIAAEFVNQLNYDRPALSSIALTTDTSILTAIGNDRGYNEVFSRQILANGKSGDVLIGISTSGNSQNIIEAFKVCQNQKIITIGWTGETGGKMKRYSDYCLCVPSCETPRIQESHILIGHIICGIVEDALFKNSTKAPNP
jgi:D-sedoheptulose 7-phosphate isomerase